MSTETETKTTLRLSGNPALSLRVEPNRLINTIHETAQFGAKFQWGSRSTDTGVCRLALSDEDKKVKDWFVKEVEELGCQVKIDDIGNIFALYPGQDNSAKPTGMGSHLDTQPTGGRYDGIYGVLSGLEVLRTLKENNYVPRFPIMLVNWMNEEGARFPMSIMASSVWAGLASKEDIYRMESVTDDKPVTVEHELLRIGYKGSIPSSYESIPLAAHFEIHIEQGPILENEEKKIGVVEGVQAYTWWKIHVKGKAQHTGTTPMNLRNDALLAASKMIVKANEISSKFGGLASVGIINSGPGVVNVIPDEVSFALDMRHVEDSKLEEMIQEFQNEFPKACKESGNKLKVEFEHLHTQKATHFDKTCIQCVEESALELYGSGNYRKITSGAGHDSCATNTRCPTSMIFIPSKDGVSHNPEEYSTPEQVDEGFKVLLSAVLKYDQLRTE
ncbi:Allantoate amidohydrolase [Wickerhamomyces ciferrii]|uniref:Allantoate amidohydrolase n=1 Tax=Wickerhamomyces ciferrii (strain ATCC 14091 / BCRC 22168 / CBS 111 / JCM 3599 / NBRC 0793 / NRRL Y-1031 F-60-10) TaxID=1206466 RepID=K0KLQ8_WICCF|nr:Allantoate amidohydrolase [Wickerhamomyces ciferrii]CCH46200.1 Allantoate amidohydrolase [Wickerhamomyces ciferrii]